EIADGKCKVNNDQLFNVLRAIDKIPNESHALNPKQVKYFEGGKAGDSRNPRDGFLDGSEFEGTKQGQLVDPWGAQYCFVLETDGNDELDMSTFYTDLTGNDNRIRFAAVGFCLGKDSKRGGKGYENKFRKEKSTEAPDDVVSWQ